MARAAASPTFTSFCVGEGRLGRITFGTCGVRSLECGSITCTPGLGKSRSTAVAAYVSTVTLPACVLTILYLPRLNPATGIGRSEIQCEVSIPAPLPETTGAGFPVATKVQSCG